MSDAKPVSPEHLRRHERRAWEAFPAAIAFTVRHAYAEVPTPDDVGFGSPSDQPGGAGFRPTLESRRAARATLVARGLLSADELAALAEAAATALAVRRFRERYPSPPGG